MRSSLIINNKLTLGPTITIAIKISIDSSSTTSATATTTTSTTLHLPLLYLLLVPLQLLHQWIFFHQRITNNCRDVPGVYQDANVFQQSYRTQSLSEI